MCNNPSRTIIAMTITANDEPIATPAEFLLSFKYAFDSENKN